VALLAADSRGDRFGQTMSALEAALNLVIERGEIDAAADAAEALSAAARDPRFTPGQKHRLEAAVTRLAKPRDVKAIIAALRFHSPHSAEYLAAMRLLESLGPRAIEPMLEQLADEQEMAARKSLIDLLSSIAPRYIPEVGNHVLDDRWYVVRNVVSILGATRSSSAIPYLERTLKHPEPRVRRETIRALANINDRFAHQMLVSALTDEDAQNVQLAARYLGAARVDFAIPALEHVAKGEGYGSRDSGPRVEAIESLGRMGAVSALPTLEALAGRRSLLQGGKMREIRTAADAAVQRIKTRGGTS
jgi:HEAT repeat protein